ncbi:MAG: putative bifunctional diguanylate cyclase/phosphodiesterase [Nannocystaceae bacterium]|nr:GGDEF domain-containing phosphodiesterase [bacterium]
MTKPGPDVVSLLPADPNLDRVTECIRDASPTARIAAETTLMGVRRRLRHSRCDVLLVSTDAVGTAALEDAAISSGTAIIVAMPQAPSVEERASIRSRIRAQGARTLIFGNEATRGLLECALDAAQGTVATRAPDTGRLPDSSPASITMFGHRTLSQLNVSREALFASLRSAIAAPPGTKPFTLILAAIGRFRVLCDSLLTEGTAALLHAIITRLAGSVDATDMVAYLGDGRFAVLAVGPSRPDLPAAVRACFDEPFTVAGDPVYTQVAVGLTESTRAYDSPEAVIRDGITAVRRARAGRHAAKFDTSMRVEEADELRLEGELRRAVQQQDFSLRYQPVVKLESGRPIGFEALARWTSPTRGFVSPAEFIPILERTGLIIDLGAWILHEAAAQAAAWNREFELTHPLVVSVNVSAKQLQRPELIDHVRAALESTGLQPGALKLEFTETATIEAPAEILEVLNGCKALGVDVWVDDFGTGYSSLSQLGQFPVDGLKLDKAFVDPLDGTPAGSAMARAVLGIANVVGAPVVAEGIETPAQAQELIELGCVWGQGYHFARPMAVGDAYAYVASQSAS